MCEKLVKIISTLPSDFPLYLRGKRNKSISNKKTMLFWPRIFIKECWKIVLKSKKVCGIGIVLRNVLTQRGVRRGVVNRKAKKLQSERDRERRERGVGGSGRKELENGKCL